VTRIGATGGGGWLDWFAVLSTGWKAGQAPSQSPPPPPPTIVEPTNGQVLLTWLDRIAK
jgi:hypothetical protein